MTNPPRLTEQELNYLRMCEAIAGSMSYALRGASDQQVRRIRAQLLDAKKEGVDWKRIYTSVYSSWKDCRPLLPDPDTMATQIEEFKDSAE